MQKKLALICFVFSSCFISASYADEAPTTGLLYNTKETSSLVYFCEKIDDGILECDFTQTSVRKKEKPEELEMVLKEAGKQYADFAENFKAENKDLCGSMDIMIGTLKGDLSLEQAAEAKIITNKGTFLKEMGDKSESEKAELLKTLQPISSFCDDPSQENYLNIVRAEHDRDVHTCLVGPNTYKQRFRFVTDYESGAGGWVVDSNPTGPCGIVQLSRFEPETTDSGLTFWKYIAKKAVTNPKGSVMGMSCSDLDEEEYEYDWKSRDHLMNCDFIEFSPF